MTKRFGLEIETVSVIDHAAMADMFEASGLRVDHDVTGNYQSSKWDDGWQMKHDASIHGRSGYAIEAVSPILEWNTMGRDEVKHALFVLRQYCRVNRSCGLHVHVEGSALKNPGMRRLIALWDKVEDVVFSYLPPSRRENHYCVRGTSTRDRYHALNLVPLAVRGAVEFRCHHGTLNTDKILSWAAFCVGLVEHAEMDKPIPQSVIAPWAVIHGPKLSDSMSEVCDLIGIEPQYRKLLISRFRMTLRQWGPSIK